MEFGFLFWLFLGGIIVASMQDLKRREVDNWLNLLLLVSGMVFVFFGAVLNRDSEAVFHFGFLLIVMFFVMNLFYYGRVFAGGDAKLLVSMTAFFMAGSFFGSLVNVGVFLFFLMLSGSVYGLGYSLVLYSANREKVNREMRWIVKKLGLKVLLIVAVFLMLLGFVDLIFLILGLLSILFFGLYVFAKGLENVSMVREVLGKELREGDWLVEDIKVGKRVVKADWDGLSLEDVRLLGKNKKVLIKEGLPFVPAFLIAFLGYGFLRDWFVGFLFFA